MFDSVRMRLTLWYTGVLALILVIFAFAAYFFLARALSGRTDASLAEITRAFTATFVAEQGDEKENATTGAAVASEAVREFRFRDYRFILYDESQRVVAASEDPATPPGVKGTTWMPPPSSPSIFALIEKAKRAGNSYANLTTSDQVFRAFASHLKIKKQEYTVVAIRSLHDQNEILEQAQGALYIAIPLALLLASFGGYVLARKSLAPVVAMSAQAARIGAANLHERLPVSNGRDELGQLAQVFNDLLARLDLSFEQQRRFMADASHELRTPVAIMLGESEVSLSQEERASEDYRESLAIVHDEGRRLTRVVEDLFMMARADAGQYRLTPTDFYLDELVGECVRAVRSLAAKRRVFVRHDAPNELPLRADEALIRRLIMNLLDNAIKHTPAEGQVSVRCERRGKEYAVTIADTGYGIPMEAQPHIFDRFYRVDRARSRSETGDGRGTGLGLSIARWIAEAHHGRLDLFRSDQSGSVFVATFPAPQTL